MGVLTPKTTYPEKERLFPRTGIYPIHLAADAQLPAAAAAAAATTATSRTNNNTPKAATSRFIPGPAPLTLATLTRSGLVNWYV